MSTPNHPTPTVPTAPVRLSRWGILFRFPGILVLMVAALVTVDVTMIVVATGDESFAVSDHAGDQGEAWMAQRDQGRHNRWLGWRADVTVDTPAGRDASVRYALRDRDGTPVSAATITVIGFHHARAADRRRTVLHEVAGDPGTYIGRLPMNRVGRWQLRVDVQAQGERFTSEHEASILLVAGTESD